MDGQDRLGFPTFTHADKDPVASGGFILPWYSPSRSSEPLLWS
jgi:hypothetical protein